MIMAYFGIALLAALGITQIVIAWKTVTRLTNDIDDLPKEEI